MARTYKQLSLEERSLLQTQLVMACSVRVPPSPGRCFATAGNRAPKCRGRAAVGATAVTWLGPPTGAPSACTPPRVARKLIPGNPLWQLVIQHLRRRLCNVIVPTWVCNARPATGSGDVAATGTSLV
jgi:hypothetical protein